MTPVPSSAPEREAGAAARAPLRPAIYRELPDDPLDADPQPRQGVQAVPAGR